MEFSHSPKAQEMMARVKAFMDEHIIPNERAYYEQLGPENPDWTQWKVQPLMEEWKAKAKDAGLWNLFLPDEEYGAGLSNRDYAPLAEIMGYSLFASEAFNCSAPDTGNMEVLVKYGSPAQKKQWLEPLLEGTIRSVFFMTEPGVASSDATNMEATCVIDGDEVVINGRKWWSSNVGHPNCKIGIFMGVTDPNAARHARHSMVLVPLDTPA